MWDNWEKKKVQCIVFFCVAYLAARAMFGSIPGANVKGIRADPAGSGPLQYDCCYGHYLNRSSYPGQNKNTYL